MNLLNNPIIAERKIPFFILNSRNLMKILHILTNDFPSLYLIFHEITISFNNDNNEKQNINFHKFLIENLIPNSLFYFSDYFLKEEFCFKGKK